MREQDLFAAVSPTLRRRLEKILVKAKKGSHLQVLDKLTDLVDNKHSHSRIVVMNYVELI